MATDIYRETLIADINELKLTVDLQQVDLLLAYHQLLIKWNKAYNLTAVRDPQQMIARHLSDSLSLVPFIKANTAAKRFIDVGSGAGLPGIILAIVFSERQFDLLDSNGKKTRFLLQAKMELGLHNVTVHHCRVEQHLPAQLYDGILSRAFSTLQHMVTASHHLLTPAGLFYAMKGIYPQQELSELEKTYKVSACHKLQIPGEDADRHLVILSK